MTREKEIKEASFEHLRQVLNSEIYTDSFKAGVEWANNHLKSSWISVKNILPPEGEEVIAFHHKWIDKDFNPNGTRIGFLNGNNEFTSAYWWDYQDCYETINKSNCEANEDFYRSHIDNTEPEYWCYIPKPPKE